VLATALASMSKSASNDKSEGMKEADQRNMNRKSAAASSSLDLSRRSA